MRLAREREHVPVAGERVARVALVRDDAHAAQRLEVPARLERPVLAARFAAPAKKRLAEERDHAIVGGPAAGVDEALDEERRLARRTRLGIALGRPIAHAARLLDHHLRALAAELRLDDDVGAPLGRVERRAGLHARPARHRHAGAREPLVLLAFRMLEALADAA